MIKRVVLCGAVSVLALAASPALARRTDRTGSVAAPDEPVDPASQASDSTGDSDIVVTARRLDAARAAVQPSLGATRYTVTNATIQALPGGDNQQFNQIVLQLPGVVQDGFGQLHIRDDHNNLQYRINGTILPEGVSVFGQTLSPRLIERFSLLTGALPSQYGLRTAGIIDVTTKSGLFDNGGSASIYGGSHGLIEPSLEYGGSSGSTNFFVSGDYRHGDLGIESVDGSSTPLHDRTNQYQAFTYLDHIFDANNRVSFIGGYSNQDFQIPDPRGLQPDGSFTIGGRSAFPSDDLRERQLEKTAFGIVSLLHDEGPFTGQASLFLRDSTLDYYPDIRGELLFNGIAQRAAKHDFTFGLQADAAYRVGGANTIRGGFEISRDRGYSRTTTQVFPVDANGDQSGEPVVIVDNGGKTQYTYSVYLQDEVKLLPTLTFNVGGRFDHYDGYRSEQQFSPRANLVWQPATGTTVHAGYARYFSPPPFELVANTSVVKFVGTSAQAPSDQDTTPFAERQDYYDVGIQQEAGALTFGIDGYIRRSRDLIDEGQFGAPIVLTPFNYRRGRIHGVEGNISYAARGLLAYANFAYAKAQGRQITSSEFNFEGPASDPATELGYIRTHYVYLDHDQTYTGSAGISYAVAHGPLAGLKVGGDMIYGSGLRADDDVNGIPNGLALKDYVQFNTTISYKLARPGIEFRFDIVNAGDHVYEIRDGSGIGVGAAQYGPRRGFFGGISKTF